MDLIRTMKRVELFRGLSEEQLQRLVDISHRESFKKNTVIFEQNTVGDRMYIISDGQVEVLVRDSEGGERAAVYLGAGQVFGEMALIDESTRSAAVIAVEDGTVVYGIPRKDFIDLCQSDTAIGYVMMRNLAQDLSFKLRHRDMDPSEH
jgi:CRP/FNR family transcriptional regulator, cyclic AMP receptor protein